MDKKRKNTLKFSIPFGKGNIKFKLPSSNFFEVKDRKNMEALENTEEAIFNSLNNPIGVPSLKDIASMKKSVCIVTTDITRSIPYKVILQPILKILHDSNIKKENIKFLVGIGTHRPNSMDELRDFLGEEIVDNYQVINHDAFDNMINVEIGQINNGKKVKINKNFIEADLRIVTGLIRPHTWAGFSGGSKGICPGISSLETIKITHCPQTCREYKGGTFENNMFHDLTVKIGSMARVDFLCNVVLNEDKKIAGVFSGDLIKAHEKGVFLCKKFTHLTYSDYADIVIVSNGGYPYDSNLVSEMAGMVSCINILKENGVLILAAECSEESGDQDIFKELFKFKDFDDFYKKTINICEYERRSQWYAELTFKMAKRNTIYMYSPGLKDFYFPHHIMKKINSIEEGVDLALKKCGSNAKISILKEASLVSTSVST
ncbi:MAG: nickel-dependent lactate racemase family protein [Candidatus Humimicrobiaceae bacterium]